MPINTSFLTVFILSFWGIRQAYCPYAFRFSEIFQKNPLLFFEVEELKRERGKERKKERERKEKAEKLAKLAKLDQLERVKRADALRPLSLFSPTLLAFLGSCTRSDG